MDDDLDPTDTPEDFNSRFGDWAQQNLDERTAQRLATDPVSAINSLVNRGIAPPDFHAPVRDPSQGNLTDDLSSKPLPFADPDAPPSTQTSPAYTIPPTITEPPLSPIERTFYSDVKTLADRAAPKPSVALAAKDNPNPLDPEENPSPVAPGTVPLPRENPNRMTDVSADSKKKKGDADGAISDFAKSFQGVKALQPPPVNPVGTPSVRSPSAVTAPNVANIMQMGQAARANAILPLLGKLLVMGKA